MFGINKTGWLNRKNFLIPLVVLAAACVEGTNEKELMDRAKGYLETRDLNAASIELKNILRNDAKNAEARYLLAKINLNLGEMKTAQKELRRAMDAGWDESAVQLMFAEVLYRQGYFQEVLDDIPIKDSYPDPVKADLTGFWAAAEVSLGKWDEAEQTIKTGELLSGDALWLLQSKIRLAIHKKDLQMAGEILDHALEVHPDSQDLWLLSASLAEEEGELANVDIALQKVVDLDPPRNITVWGRRARLSQAQIWLRQKNSEKAQLVIAPVLKTYPGDPLANYFGGLIAFMQGEPGLTEERLLIALKVAPEHKPSLILFGVLNYARGDYRQATYYLEKVAATHPDEIGVQTLLGKSYFMLGQYDEAENRLNFASSKVDDNAELIALVGLTRLKAGDVQAGIQALEKAAVAAPTDIAIRNELAKAYLSSGETEQAIKYLESALVGSDKQYRAEALLLMAYFKAGEFDQALIQANKLSEQLPNDPLAYNLAGIAHGGKKDFSSARSSYQAALRLDPKNSVAQVGLAGLDMRAGDIQAARNHYENILKTDQDNPQALLGLAHIIGQGGGVEEAIQLVEQARLKNPGSLEPRLFLGEYYLKINVSEALVLAQESFEIAPRDSRVIVLLGRAQLGTNKGKKALTTLKTLVEQEPGWAAGYYYLAQAHIYNGDTLAARKSLKTTLQLDAGYTRARLALGKLEMQTGKSEEAMKIAQDLQKSKGNEAGGYLLEGDILMSSKKPAQAAQAYQKAFDRSPGSNAVLKLYYAKKSMGNVEDAFHTLEKWLEQNPQDGAVRQVLASAHQSNGNIDRAIAEYEKVLELRPNSSVALNNLAWLYFQEKNEKKRALGYAKRAHKLSPDNVAILDTYGWLLLETGSLQQGFGMLYKAASNSDNESIHYHLAVAHSRIGERDNAIEELKRLVASEKTFPEKDEAKVLLQKLK